MQCGSYGLKLRGLNGYFFICSTSTSTCFILSISYNPIRNGRAGQGAFFFRCSLPVNPIKMWYVTSHMTSTSKANFGRTWGGSLYLTFRWKCQMVRHTNFQCLVMPPSLPLTCKLDLIQISSYTLRWQNGCIAICLLLWSSIRTTTWNMCSQQSPLVTMPIPSSGTHVEHKMHLGYMQPCKSLHAYVRVTIEPSWIVPLADEPVCQTSCMV